jgi:hypothetical protein
MVSRISAALLVSGGFVGLASAEPAQALPTCTRVVNWEDASGQVFIPLPASAGGSWDCLLAIGSDSAAVVDLQVSLAQCNGESLVADGSYGPKTQAAVRAVQLRLDISADGTYGPQTKNAMRWLTYRSDGSTLPTCFAFDQDP